MTLSPSTTRFLTALAAQVSGTLTWWTAAYPGRPLDPGVATGLCPRRFPVNYKGQVLLSLDERLWERGRARYGVRR